MERLDQYVEAAQSHYDLAAGAMLIGGARGHDHAPLDHEEFAALRNVLTAIREDDWLGLHITIESEFFGEGRRRTPAEVIKSLEDYVREFDLMRDTTLDMPKR